MVAEESFSMPVLNARRQVRIVSQVEATGPGNGRFPRIPAISRKQYSGPGNLRIFPVNSAKFLLVPAGNHRKSPGKSGEIRPGILLPGSGDIRRFPARSGAFPACFWPVPIKSAHFRRPETSSWVAHYSSLFYKKFL